MERWKKINVEHFEYLSISTEGRLRNDVTMECYKLRVSKKGKTAYCGVDKTINGVVYRRTFSIPTEVAKAFIPKPEDAHEVVYKATHKQGFSKLINTTKSLEWKTNSEILKGVKKPNRKPKTKILSKKHYLNEKRILEERLEIIDNVLNNNFK